MLIRRERPDDVAAIRAVLEAAFPGPEEARLVEELRADGDAAIALVAETGGVVVGHVMFSPMTGPLRALGLAPVAVAPAHQRSGVGGGLIRQGLAEARAAGVQAVFVLGDPAYYRRFGFEPRLAEGFASPYAGPYLMVLALGGPLPATSGRVDYAPAFGRLGSAASDGNSL
ncbi:GNAT family N-acetyltransferase [Phreatobacter sp. AB_2022a]|uniref:GNAT family N-acetyltransferase n=1 Tax=Phreatobacter sp. AB_2022a TaxID=3003134 RepID=UPI002287179F|nr:N-acetyltransferase [Phreatobacter sp. AB_2022a]MCZ0732816.1 N-acetyltransferase [Phreatobacter sp. AB_2022a]